MTDFIIVRDWGDFFLRDDTELRKYLECFADQVEAYSLFQREPYGRVHVYGGSKEWALKEAELEVQGQRAAKNTSTTTKWVDINK